MEARSFAGQCHCGAVSFTVRTDLSGLLDCNCSRCRRLGWVMQSVPASDFELLSGSETLKPYHFNTHKIDHQFCTECGIEAFARGSDAQGNGVVMINVNCLEDVPEFDRASIQHWDGKNW